MTRFCKKPVRPATAIAAGILVCVLVGAPRQAPAQSAMFAGNAQHTSEYPAAAQLLNTIRWTTTIDTNNTGALAHYGSPLISQNNTVFVPVKIANDGFRVDAFDGSNGTSRYSAFTDYVLPAHNWIPAYNPCISTTQAGTRLYYAGAGGTLWHIDNPDSVAHGNPVRDVFYTSLAGYNANAAAFNASVFVDTPLTSDSAGNIYFGFRVQGTAPAPLATTQSGYARIDRNGNGSFILAGVAAGDAQISLDSHNSAPALSSDETTLYVVVKWATDRNYCYLLGLNSTTLATKYSVFLRDPRSNSPAGITDDGTASPMIGPDGDVYFGVLGNPSDNGSRGFLLHFSADLSVTKLPGGFGWDYTAGVVPASMVPSYKGASSYLLFCKYNDYAFQDGTGVNRVAILDPTDSQIDPHPTSGGLSEMREVMTVIGPTPDFDNPGVPNAVKEWCINTPAVNPATGSVFFDSEDGRLYRWNLAANSLDQAVALTAGFGEPYVPTVMGPDGSVYTLNGGTLFSLGEKQGVKVTLTSSRPDLQSVVAGDSVTFTATVSGTGPTPTGTISFNDLTFNDTGTVSNTLASAVPLDANGRAQISTSSLAAGAGNRGTHFITASYSGDAVHTAASATVLQKVHANATSTRLTATPNPATAGQPVVITATVAGVPSGSASPSGMVTFFDGNTVIGQSALNSSGMVSITRSNLLFGPHTLTAQYVSDTAFASSASFANLNVNPAVFPAIQFGSPTVSSGESTGVFSVPVSRSGDTTGISTVDFATSDSAGSSDCNVTNGAASSRCDYTATTGTLRFASGETFKVIDVPIINDSRVEGDETLTLTLSNPVAAALGATSAATLTIKDNDSGAETANPIDDPQFFVRQHYLDFLNRTPDADGLAYWTDQIKGNVTNTPAPCPVGDAACVNSRRVNVSDAFFFEDEFQQTGAYVYRLYRAAYGNNQPAPNPNTDAGFPNENLKLPAYTNFENDRASVPGGPDLAQEQLVLANNFVGRPEFVARYPLSLGTADQFVDAVLATLNSTGVNLGTERTNLISQYNALGRGGVLYRLAGDDANNPVSNQPFIDAEYNREFVFAEYGGYLRRDSDIAGFEFWLGQVNGGPLRDVSKQHAMVCSFITSREYQLRFSNVVLHNNDECPR